MKNESLQPVPFSVERIPGDPPLVDDLQLQGLARVYADVFAGPPWNEYTQCPKEGIFFGKATSPSQPCPCCNESLTLAYPPRETAGYIKRELKRPDATLFLLQNGNELAGFSWGFSYNTPEAFAEEKYRTNAMKISITNLLKNQGVKGKFFYLSESGIVNDPPFRGRGISNQFHNLRLGVARELGIPALQRTSCEGPMYRTSLKSGMRQIMGPEVIVDTQARTFIRTGKIINNFLDKEIEPRVLFVVQ